MRSLTFFRAAAIVPVLVPAACGVVMLLTADATSERLGAFGSSVELAGFLAIAGAVSAVPYAVVVGYLFLVEKPATEDELRQALRATPTRVALLGTALGAVLGFVDGGLNGALAVGGFVLMLGVAVGFLYALLIHGAYAMAKRGGVVAG